MRILVVDAYYPAFLRDFYARQSGLPDRSYAEHWRILMDESFGTADFYSASLKEEGCDAHEVVVNCLPLQRRWAKERKPFLWAMCPVRCSFGGTRGWESAVARAQIEWFKPDVVYVQDMNWPHRKFLQWARANVSLVVGQHASLVTTGLNFDLYDVILSSLPNILDLVVSIGVRGEYLKLAFEPRILEHLHRDTEPWKVVHIGGYGPIHEERNTLLERVARKIPIDFWGYDLDYLESDSPVRRGYHGEAWGLRMYEIRHNSLIVLTGHISRVADGFANNMTLYEATGVGACLVTDFKDNLGNILEPEQEVVTYRSAEECVEKVHYLLDHEEERARIANRGQEKTLREHTYRQRMKELVDILHKHLSISGRSRRR
jgi:spore maturation protein CgeB